MPAPVRVTWSTLPARRSRFWARSASSTTVFQWAPSPAVTNIVPSAAKWIAPVEWPGPSVGMQSAPTGKLLHELPTTEPRIGVSLDLDAVSPDTVTRESRAVLVPS